jgi:hypothetical protein
MNPKSGNREGLIIGTLSTQTRNIRPIKWLSACSNVVTTFDFTTAIWKPA